MKRLTSPVIALAAFAALALPAMADAKTEAYVQKNASDVLASLNDPTLNADQRTAKFNAYMDQFTDMEAVANFA
ncbi:MAG: ABC transporter substrate-binding protein, partial [Hyphomonas sp.]|nr:ABC transporter substrate-binding protein [Hyphomonas sp.]